MNSLKISYQINTHNETNTLKKLLDKIHNFKDYIDEVIIFDDFSENKETINIITEFENKTNNVKIIQHKLDNNYEKHKNESLKYLTGQYCFSIDADECPSEMLLYNIKDIINLNPGIELFYVTRINDFIGNHELIAKQWGWHLTPSTTITHTRQIDNRSDEYIFLKNNGYIISDELITSDIIKINDKVTNIIKYKAVLVNVPDPQPRIFLNKPDRIKWVGKLHEHISGNRNHVYLPFDEELSLYHDKSIETQIQTNRRYNSLFTEEENRGYRLPI